MAGIKVIQRDIKLIKAIVFFALLVSGSAFAVEIYQWRDANGRLHFADNIAKVPAQYREAGKRDVSALPTMPSESQKDYFTGMEGKLKWKNLCSECHYPGDGVKGGAKVGLARLLVNDQTKFPATIDEVLEGVRRAANGYYSSMPRMEISDDDMKMIAEYLVGMQK